MLSGIGPAAHLREMGIEVVKDAPGVGGNYQDHVASPVHMETKNSTSYGLSWPALPRDIVHLFQYMLTRTGPLAGNVFESVAFLRTDPSLKKPDVQFVFQPAKRLTNLKIPFPIGHGYAISPVALYPKARGTLRLASADPSAAPVIDPKLLSEPGEIDSLVRAIKIARKVFASEAFAQYGGIEVAPGPESRPTPRSTPISAAPAIPCTTRSAPAGWAATRTRWSIPNCASTGSRDCGSPMPA